MLLAVLYAVRKLAKNVCKLVTEIVFPDATPPLFVAASVCLNPVRKWLTFVQLKTIPAVGLVPVLPPPPVTFNKACIFLIFVYKAVSVLRALTIVAAVIGPPAVPILAPVAVAVVPDVVPAKQAVAISVNGLAFVP